MKEIKKLKRTLQSTSSQIGIGNGNYMEEVVKSSLRLN